MIYIYIAKTQSDWTLPFYLFANSISIILSDNKIDNKIISNYNNIKLSDIIITFQPFYSPDINCKVIFINSESLMCQKHIQDQIENNNVKLIWDYNKKNVNIIKKSSSKNITFLPFTYHSYLEDHYNKYTNSIKEEKEIDFLFFGFITKRRDVIIDTLIDKGYNIVKLNTVNVKELYQTIKKSKIIIIIHHYHKNLAIDFYRLSWLLSNKVFVIHEEPSEDCKDQSFDKIIYAKYDNFIDRCEYYIKKNQNERDKISNEIYNWWKGSHSLENKIPIKQLMELNNSL